ncbi:cytochrome [Mycolicibacter heraklionensis]|nr:cytochrome [Mycolicibacter heraklionensis]
MSRDGRCPFAPPPETMALAGQRPLSRVRIWDGSTPWLITGYEAVRTLFSDPRVSVDDHQPGFPHWNEAMRASVDHRPKSVFTTDGAEHIRFRRILSPALTMKRVEAMKPVTQRITDEHIDAILTGPQPADLVEGFALPIPSLVISELLGVPYEDHEFFQQHATMGVDRYATSDALAAGATELSKYLVRLLEAKMADPAEDMVSDLGKRVKNGDLSVREATQLGTGMLIAGHETTANMIGLGIAALLREPDKVAEKTEVFRVGDDAAVANAVEELLRYLSIIQNGQRRVALDDIEIAGETIRAGEGIIIDLAPANWDASVFPEPDVLDLERPARQHMAFGFGPHQCVGQQLARAEMVIAFRTLFQRIPTLKLAVDIAEIPFKNDRLAYGVYELPVTW